MAKRKNLNRRNFLKYALLGGTSAMLAGRITGATTAWAESLSEGTTSRVALTAGADRADNIFRGMQMFRNEIAAAIGNRRVLLKPNVVIHKHDAWRYNGKPADLLLSDTNSLQLEGILEFLKSIGKTDVVIGESTATGATFAGYDNLGYLDLIKRYPFAKLIDLNQERYEITRVTSGDIRVSSLLKDPDIFMISAAKFKCHNNAIITLGLKNVAMGAPIIDLNRKNNNKSNMHGRGNQDLNDNLFNVAQFGIQPSLCVLDGYEGMEGNGPNHGDPVDHRVAVVSPDWLAADRVAMELMDLPNTLTGLGQDEGTPAYYRYCAQAGYGEFDLNKIEVMGESIADHVITYKMHDDIMSQINMDPTAPTTRSAAAMAAARSTKRYSSPPLNGFYLTNK